MKKPERETELLEILDTRLSIYLRRVAPDSVIITTDRDIDDFIESGVTVTRLRLAITDYERGTGLLRMIFGMPFLGGVKIQIEGQLRDLRTSDVLAEFARRTANAGTAWGFATPQSLSAFYSWKMAIDEACVPLALYISSQLTPPPPRWWDALAPRRTGRPSSPTPTPPPDRRGPLLPPRR